MVNEPFVAIFDNARAHGGVLPLLEDGQIYSHLPPYSPFLNITEQAISCLKAKVKSELTTPQNVQIINNPPPGRPLHQWRMEQLQRIVEEMPTVTQVKWQNWYGHSFAYIPRCIAREVILFCVVFF